MDFLLGLAPLFGLFVDLIGKAISAFVIGFFCLLGREDSVEKVWTTRHF